MKLLRKIIVVGLLASIAGCTKPPPPPPPPPPPVPPVVIIVPPRPLPPGNASTTQILPGRALDGRFVTANSNITGDRAFWQLKIGLNVAAIGCRGLEEATMVSSYNAIIKNHAKAIKATEKTVITQLGKENKTNGIKERDRLSTQLFNYFAQPLGAARILRPRQRDRGAGIDDARRRSRRAGAGPSRAPRPALRRFLRGLCPISGGRDGMGCQICAAAARHERAGAADHQPRRALRAGDGRDAGHGLWPDDGDANQPRRLGKLHARPWRRGAASGSTFGT
ncbi:hypothetical protein [Sphingopyxis sp. PET50]|uniref:hypothetical protein n=1 Tax=Sphingopyxis sp. PET50 TaxID=2976533 RepID=UPI0021AF0351|nr:hypothetical protein [Sphingopyxis sp. PET50]